MAGKSTSASIGRLPSCCQICSYSCRTSSFVGCGDQCDADAPEVFEARLDGAVALIQASCKRFTRRHATAALSARFCGAARQHREPLFRRREIAGQELALGPVELEREGECVPPLPAVLRQQRRAGGEIGQRRGIGGRSLGPLASNEIELGDPLALLSRT